MAQTAARDKHPDRLRAVPDAPGSAPGPARPGRSSTRRSGDDTQRVDEERIAQARDRQVATIGRRINDLRRNRYTLGQLADASGVSVGLLSRLENGIGNPSFTSLNAIARALDVDVRTFFDAPDHSAVVLRHGKRTVIRNAATKVECELLTSTLSAAQRTGLVATLIQLPRNPTTDEWVEETTSSRDQLEFVLRGTVSVQVDNEIYQLEEGDAIMFDASRRHRHLNVGDMDTALVFCVSREIDFL